jgi:TcpE family
MDDFATIRNYQRIFRPDHRIYAIDGRSIPVPGGVPIAWLAYFAATLLTVILLTAGSLLLAVLLAAIAGLYGLYIGNALSAVVAAVAAFLLVPVVGGAVEVLDWPLRLLILPGLVATLGTQLAPDGRKPHRYAANWLTFHLRPHRRSLARAVAPDGAPSAPYNAELWVAPDEHCVELRRACLRGPGVVRFRDELAVSHRGRRHRRIIARQLAPGQQPGNREVLVDSVGLEPAQTLEVRP